MVLNNLPRVTILRADAQSVSQAAEVFDLYRQHFEQESNIAACEDYLVARQKAAESILFFARDDKGNVLGFTQLYPTFSSVTFRRDLILNDLFVLEASRGQGVARKLLAAARNYGEEIGSKGILLVTGIENTNAQNLYETFGFHKDSDYIYYYLSL